MQLKSLDIGRLSTKNNVFLAPLAGFSDYAFRKICYSLGAGLCFTEMVSAKGLMYNGEGTRALLKTTPDEYIKAVQLFGDDPFIMGRACKSADLEPFDIVDINMGCPVPKVFNNGEGSCLLNRIPVAARVIESCVKSGKTVTVKMRLGVEKGNFTALELARAAEDSGAQMITVHGRYREDYYSGDADYEAIKRVVDGVNIPVIANGNIFSKEDADLCMEKTGASGVMLARGALRAPWLFAELTGVTGYDKKEIVNRHIDLLLEEYDDRQVAVIMRKQMALYLSGVRDAKRFKMMAFSATTTRELKEIIAQLQL